MSNKPSGTRDHPARPKHGDVRMAAKEFGVGYETVRQVLSRNKVSLTEIQERLKAEQRERILRELGEHPSYKDVLRLAAEGISEEWIRDVCGEEGIPISPRPMVRSAKTMRVEKRLMAGERIEDIALVEGCKVWWINQVKRRLEEKDGIQLPKRTREIPF